MSSRVEIVLFAGLDFRLERTESLRVPHCRSVSVTLVSSSLSLSMSVESSVEAEVWPSNVEMGNMGSMENKGAVKVLCSSPVFVKKGSGAGIPEP